MPTYEIEKDGRTYQIDGPPGATREQVIAAIERQMASSRPAPRQRPVARRPSAAQDIAATLATFNAAVPFADEFADAAQAVVNAATGRSRGLAQGWQQARQASQEAIRDLERRRPVVANLASGAGLAGQALAALATGGASAGLTAASAARPIASAATTSALAGAVNRFADRGTVRERVAAASRPGAIATDVALGAAIPAALRGVEAAGNVRLPQRGGAEARRQAARILARARQGQAETPPTANALPFETMGRRARTIAQATAAVPGPGQEIAERALQRRAAGAPGRMLAATQQELGDGRQFYSTLEELSQARRTQAAPLYEQAYQQGVFPSDFQERIAPILQTPAGQQAMRNAVTLARNERVPLNNIGIQIDDQAGTVSMGPVPNMRTLDYVRRGLDDVLESTRDPVTGRLPARNDVRVLSELRADLNRQLTELNPTYGQALEAWSGPSRAIDAMQRGRRLASGRADPEVVEGVAGRMTQTERDAMRLGASRVISDRLRTRNPMAEIRALTGDVNYQERLRPMFSDQASFDRFLQAARSEADMQASANQILSGSRTTPLREAVESVQADATDGGLDAVAGALERRAGGETFIRQAVRGAVQMWLRSRNSGLNNPEVSRIVGEAMFENPRLVDQIIAEEAAALRIAPGELRALLLPSAAGLGSMQPTAPQSAPMQRQ